MKKRGPHKGNIGVVLVVGGSEDYVGAPALCGLAALRSGADLAIVAAPEKVAYAINRMGPDLITKKLPGKCLSKRHVKAITELAKKADCVVIGPGLGTGKATMSAVRELAGKIRKPLVLDADALKAGPPLRNCVVTPHSKEFELLFGKKASRANAKKAASPGCIVLLKGPVDIITDGKVVKENKAGHDSMTKGGTGDFLAGVVAGLIAQGVPLFKAAQMGAWANGRAGEIMFKKMGYGYLASDMVLGLPKAMQELRKRCKS